MSAQAKRMLLVVTLSVLPLIAAPHAPNVQEWRQRIAPSAFCGEVQAFDFFEQTFLVRLGDGNVDTIPFSRFTDFFRRSGAKGHLHRDIIDPTEVTVGDRLRIQLDPSEATAASIEVLPAGSVPARTLSGDARRPRP